MPTLIHTCDSSAGSGPVSVTGRRRRPGRSSIGLEKRGGAGYIPMFLWTDSDTSKDRLRPDHNHRPFNPADTITTTIATPPVPNLSPP
jgi:hypothetical protein